MEISLATPEMVAMMLAFYPGDIAYFDEKAKKLQIFVSLDKTEQSTYEEDYVNTRNEMIVASHAVNSYSGNISYRKNVQKFFSTEEGEE
jgi:hypothetical protein